jgi:predicted nucleic acid-binding protein
MPEPRCTVDSSAVIALDHLSLLPQLSLLFSQVLIPTAVRQETSEREETRERLDALLSEYGFVQVCTDFDPAAVEIYFSERKTENRRGRGEAETVQQAAQTGAVAIIDDGWGRKIAERIGIGCHGTMWVLEQFHALELLTAAEVRASFLKLRLRGFRLPWSLVNQFLEAIGEAGV